MPQVTLGLGSNLGEPLQHLKYGLSRLESALGPPVRCSAVYVTEPVGTPPQPDFHNIVTIFETNLSPEEVLEEILRIEGEAGRHRETPNAPRTLDIDILLYEGQTRATPQLTVPHPRMEERAFVLVPLAAIAPDRRLPSGELVELRMREPWILSQRIERLPNGVLPIRSRG